MVVLDHRPFLGSPIHYVHGEQVSLKSQFFQVAAGLSGTKNHIEKQLKHGGLHKDAATIPESLRAKSFISKDIVDNRPVWTIAPRQNASEKVILVIHGGTHYGNLTKFTWGLTEELLHRTGATFVVPDYPLAPEASYQDVYECVSQVYQHLLTRHSPEDIVVMGNSSGGGFALGFAMSLRDKGVPQPGHVLLLAPWLDQTLTNPDIAAIDRKDTILGIKGLRMAGQLHARGLDLHDYRISPIYGDLSGLPKLSVFIGTNDLFFADVRKLMRRANESSVSINYFEYPRMFHMWMFMTKLPEAQHAVEQIAALINGVAPLRVEQNGVSQQHRNLLLGDRSFAQLE